MKLAKSARLYAVLKKEIQRDEGKIEQIKTEITDKTAQLETMTPQLQHKTAQ